MKRAALIRAATAVAAALLLQACGSLPAAPTLAAAVPPSWQGAAAAAPGVPVRSGWWSAFGDPVLDGLVQQALAHNTDLRAAAARVAEARALADVQHAAAWPTLDFGLGGQRSRSISAATGKPYLSSVLQPQFQAAYEVDLWGRVSSLGQAADALVLSSEDTRDSAALSVAATTAASYINLRALDARLEVARQTLAARQSALELARSRQQRGYSSELETAQSEAEYRSTAQAIPQLELAIVRQEHVIDLLTGAAPGPVPRGLPLVELKLPALPDAGLPSELLRRRPDLASAEAQLAATDAQLAAARAQLLPSLHLGATLGSISSSALSGDPFKLWSIGGSVLAPIFDGGRLKAQVRASDARRELALASYEKAVLTAFAEVEDQLSAVGDLGRQGQQAEAQRVALQEAVRVATNRYREGYASYLDELDAQRNLFSAQQAELQLRADQLAAQVGLYRALGGGWQPEAAKPATAG
ncbi:efflux transporter outer membrane subunit [Variovorax saccharolyticus]|uniref:efflux transporter outer membrane subunit n=1 Tax=Variovorax saccharolyticus TaxID=3053516 RepID=UPI0025750AB6|nr:efflux transporter outer membrane subunit [Variovorax sp. J31P216]MDM0027913.1 efflux transporter outer membrane subunit [Variovorax sp. J31P216]